MSLWRINFSNRSLTLFKLCNSSSNFLLWGFFFAKKKRETVSNVARVYMIVCLCSLSDCRDLITHRIDSESDCTENFVIAIALVSIRARIPVMVSEISEMPNGIDNISSFILRISCIIIRRYLRVQFSTSDAMRNFVSRNYINYNNWIRKRSYWFGNYDDMKCTSEIKLINSNNIIALVNE